MLGLSLVFVVTVYFIVLFWLTFAAGSWASRRGYAKKTVALCAFLAFSLLFVPVFWDWIPSYKSYKRYCETEAGVTQYKTLKQWRLENPGAYENLYHYTDKDRKERERREKQLSIVRNGKIVNVFTMTTPRFGVYYYWEELPFTIIKNITEFIDVETGEIIAKSIEFGAGPGNVLEFGSRGRGYKIWLNEPLCGDERRQFSKIIHKFEKLESDYILKNYSEKGEQEKRETKQKAHCVYFCK